MGKLNKNGYLIHNQDHHVKNESHSKLIFTILCRVVENIDILDDGTVDKYKYDVEVMNSNTFEIIKVELENRAKKHFDNIWNSRYSSLDIPERKLNYKNESDMYIVTCVGDYQRFMVIKEFQDVLKNSEVYEKYNSYTKDTERFIKVPLSCLYRIDIENLIPAQKKKYKEILQKTLDKKQ